MKIVLLVRKKKVKRSKKKVKYSIEYQTNEDLKHYNKNDKSYFKYDQCTKISGVVGYINQRPKSSNDYTIKILPIYISINQQTLNLFHSFDSNTLFKSITLDSLARIDISYPKTNCFDLIIHFVDGENLSIGPLSLCAKSLKTMKDWITAILQIKECKLTQSIHQGKTLIDFNAINALKNKVIKEKAENLKNLKYANTRTVNRSRFSTLQMQQIKKNNALNNRIN